MTIRSVIVDDETLARHSIRRFLKCHSDVDVVEECSDGQAAVQAIRAQRPDLVFLDVQMPELDGFGVIERVGIEQMPATIFVTAYDQYAVAAFDANAADYLLKPFGQARFERALARAREHLSGASGHEVLRQLIKRLQVERESMDTVPVAKNGRILLVRTKDIQWIESAGNYVRLHLGSEHHEIREALTSFESRLDPRDFVRIHRSIVVNLQYVKEVQPWFHGYHLVVLKNGQELRMSRYQKDVARRLGVTRQVSAGES